MVSIAYTIFTPEDSKPKVVFAVHGGYLTATFNISVFRNVQSQVLPLWVLNVC